MAIWEQLSQELARSEAGAAVDRWGPVLRPFLGHEESGAPRPPSPAMRCMLFGGAAATLCHKIHQSLAIQMLAPVLSPSHAALLPTRPPARPRRLPLPAVTRQGEDVVVEFYVPQALDIAGALHALRQQLRSPSFGSLQDGMHGSSVTEVGGFQKAPIRTCLPARAARLRSIQQAGRGRVQASSGPCKLSANGWAVPHLAWQACLA